MKEPYLLQLPRSRQPPTDYVLESSTKEVHRYSTPTLRGLVTDLNDANQKLVQASSNLQFVDYSADRLFLN